MHGGGWGGGAHISGSHFAGAHFAHAGFSPRFSHVAFHGRFHHRFHRFAFVAYGTVYSYLGISYLVLMPRRIDTTFALSYLIVSGSLVILSMVLLSRRVGREA